MAKDPSFLFYSKDWLEGTAELTHQEKGVYIDLLAHQHQKGSLPADTKRLARIVGLSEAEFLAIWEGLKIKFTIQSDNRLVNRKLTEVMTERSTKSHINRITARFATLIRSVNYLPKHDVETLKKQFKITDFDHYPTEQATERLTEWFNKRLKSIEDGNANINKDSKGGMGEKEGGKHLAPEMVKIFKESFPDYPSDFETDSPNCWQIACKIASEKKWTVESLTNGNLANALLEWRAIVVFSKADPWFSTRAISDFNKEYQRLRQKMINSNGNGIHKQTTSTVGKTMDFDKP